MISYFKNIFILLVLCQKLTLAQQVRLNNTYSIDFKQLNIAYSNDSSNEYSAQYRNQWLGIPNNPKSFQLNIKLLLGKNNGLAVRLNSQSQGLLNQMGAIIGYSYKVRFNKKTNLHLGLGIGLTQSTFNSQNAIVTSYSDVTLNNSSKQVALGFDSEVGAFLSSKKLKIGLNVFHLYNTNTEFVGGTAFSWMPQINSQLSYVILKKNNFELEPFLLNRYTINGNSVFEGILNINLINSITLGLGYRYKYGLLGLVSLKISRGGKVAYCFDYGNSLSGINLGFSHQIMLLFNFKKIK